MNTADGAIDGRGPPTLPNQPLPLPVGGAPKAPGAEYGGGGRVSRKFFVGGLPSSLGDADFRAHFERFGPVSTPWSWSTGRPNVLEVLAS